MHRIRYFWIVRIDKGAFKTIKTEGEVVCIALKDIPNSTKHKFVYTFEYIADDGIVHQFETTYAKNEYMPNETVTVWYFNNSKETNAYHDVGWIIFGIFMPIGLILILVDIFAIKNKKTSRDTVSLE